MSQKVDTKQTTDEVLMKGEIVAKNIQTAITVHLSSDSDFVPSKQSPEDAQTPPKLLAKKDGSFVFDWTSGQHARFLMEEIRQGLHALQTAKQPRGMDAVAFAGGREYWPRLRDIFCISYPAVRYYDLDGFERYCPKQ